MRDEKNKTGQYLTGRAVVLRLLACWDCGFESHQGNGYLSLAIVVCCQVEVSATGLSLLQMSPAECEMSESDRETSQKKLSLTRVAQS